MARQVAEVVAQPDTQRQLPPVEFSEASAMERFFIEGRIKLVYYLYAFMLATFGVGLGALQVTASEWLQSHPLRLLFAVSLTLAGTGLLAFLAVVTIRNWNGALHRYGTWKQTLLASEYGSGPQKSRKATFEPPYKALAGDPGWLTEVPAWAALFASITAQGLVVWIARAWTPLQLSSIMILLICPLLLMVFMMWVYLKQRPAQSTPNKRIEQNAKR